MRIPIICSGGIGDALLVISKFPIEFLGRVGFRFNIFYRRRENEHPALKILRPILNEIKYCIFCERSPSPFEEWLFKKLMTRAHKLKRIYQVPLTSVSSEIAPAKTTHRILVQSHMDGHHGWKGATSKIWKIERWISLLRNLHERKFEIDIMEWDNEARKQLLGAGDFVSDISHLPLIDICRKLKTYDLLISIDSWSKYPAEWYKIKQVIIAPNLQTGYTPDFAVISADYIADWWFSGLLENPRVKVIGLEHNEGSYAFSLNSLDELQVETVIGESMKLLG